MPLYDPPQRIAGTALDAMQGEILDEVRSICYHYCSINAQWFAEQRGLLPPVPAPAHAFFFHHGKIA
jgi:hypothetical protein